MLKNIHASAILVSMTALLTASSGCTKFVSVDPPPTSITGGNVFENNTSAIGVLTGIYTQMSGDGLYGFTSISFLAGLSADEFSLWNGVTDPIQLSYLNNSLTVTTGGGEEWNALYPFIYVCNSAIEGLNSNSTVSLPVRSQLVGESKFLRALFYFYLVNLYGEVPMPLSTNQNVNSGLAKSTVSSVYSQIIEDLKSAKLLLDTNYVDATLINITTERTRPIKWAANALLARVYLYTGDYADAFLEADTVIKQASLYNLDSLNGVFLKNSTEAIWQLQPVSTFVTNTQDGAMFILPPTGLNTTNDVYLSNYLLNSFEQGDLRRVNWVDSVISGADTIYFPYKYKVNGFSAPVSEYAMVLRLGEQFLIRAEAEANLGTGNLNAAVADLNQIRFRAGLNAYSGAINSTAVNQAIFHERQVEMFTELGQRWFDLKRAGDVDSVMTMVTPAKGGNRWLTTQQLYPIPAYDIQTDPKLVQNSGY